MSIQDLLNEDIGANAAPVEDALLSTIATASGQLLTPNPNRLAFIFVNLSGVDVYLRPHGTVTASNGILLAPLGGSLTVRWRDDFMMPSEDWYALAASGTANFYLVSLILQP
tara:strand:- start:456 stop:791 length:336 start_codon:yes stop_codon:yes gene_type:complete